MNITLLCMAHVILANQQSHQMKQAITEMDSIHLCLYLTSNRSPRPSEGGGEKVCYGWEWVCTSSYTLKGPATVVS